MECPVGVEGRGRDAEGGVGAVVDQFVPDRRAVEGHVPAEPIPRSASADLARPGALLLQRHEGQAVQVRLREIGEVRNVARLRQVREDLDGRGRLPEHPDFRAEPVIRAACGPDGGREPVLEIALVVEELCPRHEGEFRRDPELVVDEGLVIVRDLAGIRGLGTAVAADIHELQRRVRAAEIARSDNQVVAIPAEIEGAAPMRRDPVGPSVLVDHLEDRVVEALVEQPGIEVELADIELEGGSVREPLGRDVPRLVPGDGREAGARREVQRIREAQRSGKLLPRLVDAEIEARLDPRREPVAEIGVDLRVVLVLVLPEPVLVGLRDVEERVGIPRYAGELRVGPEGPEGAAFDAHEGRRQGREGRRRHEIDGAAEHRRAEEKRVAALVDFGRAQRERVDLVVVARAVGEIERDPVLQDLDATGMEAAGEARAADREADLLAVARLRVDARRVLHHVRDVVGVAVLEAPRVDELDRADDRLELGALGFDARHRERTVRHTGTLDRDLGQGRLGLGEDGRGGKRT